MIRRRNTCKIAIAGLAMAAAAIVGAMPFAAVAASAAMMGSPLVVPAVIAAGVGGLLAGAAAYPAFF